MEQPQPIFIVDLGVNGGTQEFRDTATFKGWIEGELAHFAWARQLQNTDSNLAELASKLKSRYRALSGRADAIDTAPESEKSVRWNELLKEVERVYSASELVHSDSNWGRWVLEQKEVDQVSAAYSLAYLLGLDLPVGRSKATIGLFEALLTKRGLDSGLPQKLLERLSESERKMTEAFAALVVEGRSNNEQLTTYIDDARAFITKASEEYRTLVSESREQLEAVVTESRAKLTDIEQAYETKLALRAPVEYWGEQQERNERLARNFGIAAAGVAVVGVSGLLVFSQILLSSAGFAVGKGASVVTVADMPLTLMTSYFLGVLLFVWVERILVRIMLSHVHLRTDASERVVMVKTYLALLKDGSGPTDENRNLLLAALFRPATTGVVSDDAAPAFWESFTRQGAKKEG